MDGPKRRRAFDAATTAGLKALGGRIRGGPLRGHRFYGGDTLGYLLGQSEPQVQQAILDYLPSGGVFYDVGANIGFLTLLGCSRGAEVHAFEPLEENLQQLRRNTDANGYQAHIHPIALSDSTGTATMAADGPLGRAHLGAGEITVDTRRLDDLGLPAPNVVKIDVEGAESRVLDGMRETLAQHRPVLIIEIHDGQERPVRERLSGYEITRLQGGGMPHLLAR